MKKLRKLTINPYPKQSISNFEMENLIGGKDFWTCVIEIANFMNVGSYAHFVKDDWGFFDGVLYNKTGQDTWSPILDFDLSYDSNGNWGWGHSRYSSQ